MSHLMFILICCIWGSSFLLQAEALKVFGPISIGACRVGGGAVAVALLWLVNRRSVPLSRRDLVPALAVAIVGNTIPFVVQPTIIRAFDDQANHGSSMAGMMIALVPIMTIVASVPILGVLPTWRQLIGVVGGLAAMLYLFADELRLGVDPANLMLASVTPLTFALANTYIKRRFSHVGVMPLALTTLLMSAVILVPAAVASETVNIDGPVLMGIGCVLVLGVLSTGLASVMFLKLIQNHGPLYAGMVAYIVPTLAVILATLRREHITRHQVIALAVIVAMVAIAQSGRAEGRV